MGKTKDGIKKQKDLEHLQVRGKLVPEKTNKVVISRTGA